MKSLLILIALIVGLAIWYQWDIARTPCEQLGYLSMRDVPYRCLRDFQERNQNLSAKDFEFKARYENPSKADPTSMRGIK